MSPGSEFRYLALLAPGSAGAGPGVGFWLPGPLPGLYSG